MIKGGEVIDPSQSIHEKSDLGITEGKIASLRKNIAPEEAREGDILTHSFRGMPNHVLQSNGEVIPELREARKRGVVIDIGHGTRSFSFKVAHSLLEQGFFPDTISSDIHVLGLRGPTYDLPTTMSKFLNLGMDIEEIVQVRGFVNSAPDFRKQPEVINGASDLLEKVFGEKGKHARCALGTSSLPRDITVELEMIIKVRER